VVPRNYFAVKRKSVGLTCKLSAMRKAIIWIFLSAILAQPQITFHSLQCHCNTSKLEQSGFLAPGLCLFGDTAYINMQYMAVGPSFDHI
jgi:hypothetical protein